MLTTWVDVDASWSAFAEHGDGPMKVADDLKRYERIIDETRPEVLVETGTRTGASALWFASHGLDVITVDIDKVPALWMHTFSDRVTGLSGASSTDADVVSRVAQLVAGRRCMVSLDSDHHAPHVVAEIGFYSPLVTAGCYLVVEDGLADLLDRSRARRFGRRIPQLGGPLAAVEQTLAAVPAWERDVDVEQLTPVTHFPAGWWRRVG